LFGAALTETPLDELDKDHGKATREFYEAFEGHDCESTTEEATQR